MTETPQFMTLTEREMALAKWIERLSEKVATDERHRVTMLFATANYLSTVNDQGEIPEPTKDEERFVLSIKQGCEARGGKRAEAAVAATAVALAALKMAMGVRP